MKSNQEPNADEKEQEDIQKLSSPKDNFFISFLLKDIDKSSDSNSDKNSDQNSMELIKEQNIKKDKQPMRHSSEQGVLGPPKQHRYYSYAQTNDNNLIYNQFNDLQIDNKKAFFNHSPNLLNHPQYKPNSYSNNYQNFGIPNSNNISMNNFQLNSQLFSPLVPNNKKMFDVPNVNKPKLFRQPPYLSPQMNQFPYQMNPAFIGNPEQMNLVRNQNLPQNFQMNPHMLMNYKMNMPPQPNQNSQNNNHNVEGKVKNPSSKKNSQEISSKKKSKQSSKVSKDSNEAISPLIYLNQTDAQLYSYIVTQKGSREIQNILKKFSEKNVDVLIKKIGPFLKEIMIDKYGNYFIQKLIQNCSPHQRINLFKNMKTNFAEISCDSFGNHPLQALIEIINMPEERKLLCECIEGNEISISLDPRGTHVIQKFLLNVPENERIPVNNTLLKNIDKLIIDSSGVCVLIKLVKHSNELSVKKTLSEFIIANNPLNLIQNPYANYAVQCLFNETDIVLCDEIIKIVIEHFFSLSMQKFSSNVVENCVKFSKEEVIKQIFDMIMKESEQKLGNMLNNTYGNFVIEKLINRLNKEDKILFGEEIRKIGKEKSLTNSIHNAIYKI